MKSKQKRSMNAAQLADELVVNELIQQNISFHVSTCD